MDEDLLISKFKSDIERAAKILEMHPSLVTRSAYREHCIGKPLNSNQLSDLGGYTHLKQLVFHTEEHPLSDKAFRGIDESEWGDYIAGLITECASHHRRDPNEIDFGMFRTYIDFAYGANSKGVGVNAISKAGGYNAIRDAYFPPKATSVLVNRKRVFEHAKTNRKLNTESVELTFITERMMEGLKKLFTDKVNVNWCSPPSSEPTERTLHLLISDLHIGSDIDGAETGYLSFGKVEESRRLAYIAQQVVGYKKEHRERTKLEVEILGDIVQGDLGHDPRDGSILSQQCIRAIYLLVQFLALLASHFPAGVAVKVTSGNHGRLISRHRSKAINQKFDSLEQMIYFALKTALPQIDFISPKTPFIISDLYGKKALFTHGDSFFTTGNISRSIPVAKLEEQINRLNAKLKDTDEFVMIGIGHVHQMCQTQLNNNCRLLINSSLCPVDPYAVSLGIVESSQGQWMFESTPDHPVGDTRFITVGSDQDDNTSLDALIKPYSFPSDNAF